MFGSKPILIVEDEPLIAMELALAVRDLDGEVLGPLPTVREALHLLDTRGVAAAILDANLLDRDVAPVALRLVAAGIPFVVHTGTGLPEAIAARFPDLPVVMKPAAPASVARQLWAEMQRLGPTPR